MPFKEITITEGNLSFISYQRSIGIWTWQIVGNLLQSLAASGYCSVSAAAHLLAVKKLQLFLSAKHP